MGITVMEATRRTAIIPIPWDIINTIKATTVQIPAPRATAAVAAANHHRQIGAMVRTATPTHLDGAARPMTRAGTTIYLKRIKPNQPTGVLMTK